MLEYLLWSVVVFRFVMRCDVGYRVPAKELFVLAVVYYLCGCSVYCVVDYVFSGLGFGVITRLSFGG